MLSASWSLCRLCLTSNNLLNIFELAEDQEDLTVVKVSIAEKINLCLPVAVVLNDPLPTHLCSPCLEAVNKFYNFWVLTDRSQKELKRRLTDDHSSSIPIPDSRKSCVRATDVGGEKAPLQVEKETPSVESNVCTDCGIHRDDFNHQRRSTSQLPCGLCQRADPVGEAAARPRRKYECSVCDYANSSLSNMKIHVMKHNGEFVAKCQYCGKGFYSKTLCEGHELTKHRNVVSPFLCAICHNSYNSKSYLRLHLKTHAPGGRNEGYQCEACGKSYLSSKGLKRHKMVAHQGQVYQCDVCDKQMKSLDSLKNHLKIHSGEKPFVCSGCGKSFRTKNALNVHERVHSGAKPFQCSTCGSRFSQSSTLKIHVRHHTGDKPYQCVDCDKRFVTTTLLRKHQTKYHVG